MITADDLEAALSGLAAALQPVTDLARLPVTAPLALREPTGDCCE